MPTITPVISVQPSPGIEITVPGARITYDQIMASLGPDVYQITEVYYNSVNQDQFFQQFYYSAYDSRGQEAANPVLTPISPSQFQNSLYLDFKGKNLYANGETGLLFNLLAGNIIQFIFWGKKKSVSDDADLIDDIFKNVELAMGKPGFFDIDQSDEKELPEIVFVPD